jgi:ribosomal protein S27E
MYLLYSSPEEKEETQEEALAQSPNSSFKYVKCPGGYKISMVFNIRKS